MKKLLSFACLFLLVFALPKPCMAQSWFDYFDYQHLVASWNWGNSRDDIPPPDFSQFPPMPTAESQTHWSGRVIASDLDLSGRDLRNARIHLLGGTLRNINFDGANLEGAIFCEVVLENCSFRGANLKNVRMIPSPNCDMTDAILGIVAGFLTEEQMRSTWNFKNRDFSNTIFHYCDFPDVEYDSSFNFTHTVFTSNSESFRDHRGTNFFYCCGLMRPIVPIPPRPIANAIPRNILFEDFSWTQLPKGIQYTAEQAFRTREFRQKSLHGLTIEGIDFTGSDFSGFTLGLFVNCTFQGADFTDATRLHAEIDDWIVNSRARESMRFGFRNCDITEEQITQTRFWKTRNLTGIVLERMNLDGWDFSNRELWYVSFEGSTARDANFENANIRSAVLPSLTIEQVRQFRGWREGGSGALIGIRFHGINFDNQNLSGFNFADSSFINCSFRNTNLTGATISPGSLIAGGNRGLTETQIRSLSIFRDDWTLRGLQERILETMIFFERQ